MFNREPPTATTGLILTGGGARAAYQVGVLKGIASILPRTVYNPFPVICGTSAGAINALTLAGRAGPLRLRTRKMEAIWANLRAEQVYRTDALGVIKNTLKVALSLFNSGYGVGQPVSLLDNTPLRDMLTRLIRFDHLQAAIDAGDLKAVALMAMSYESGKSIAFFQADSTVKPWQRARRHGLRSELGVEHLMASAAIPSLFPAVKIDGRFYGDGALRQHKPISPALHLGADRLLIIGVGNPPVVELPNPDEIHSPSVAKIVGHMLNSAFLDSMESDLETMRTINQLVAAIPERQRREHNISHLRAIETLAITPSADIDAIAERHIHELPRSIRAFLSVTGATGRGGGTSATSYLLFEPNFCRALIALGERDALAKRSSIQDFFRIASSGE